MCDGRKGESWGLVWIILGENTWKLVFYFVFFFFKPRKAEASTFITAFSYFQYGLYVKQLQFLVSIHYIKAFNVLRNWGSGVFLKCIFVSGSCQRRFHNLLRNL